ncbi:hypothetical protein [Halomonas sp.]|uniref:hypothetical protein n=1 Tax=Halomonas sp. TaxID=1486246 RepID=UPI003568E80D
MTNENNEESKVQSIMNPTKQQEIGLLAGLLDGTFVCVRWRGFMVNRTELDSIEVSREGVPLGGRMKSPDFMSLLTWLENKEALYGGAAQ